MLAATQAEKPKRHTRHTEDKLQIQCVRWMQLQYPKLAPLLHHSPNGGARSKTEGAIFKAMGTRAGFPDLFLYLPREYHLPGGGKKIIHGLAIELKTTERGSRQSDAQKQWQQQLTEQGYLYVVCRTLEEFQKVITDYIQQ